MLMASGGYIVRTTTKKEFRFNLRASNGQVILSSEGYATQANCFTGVTSLREHAEEDHTCERTSSRTGSYHFNLKVTNGQVTGASHSRETSVGMENGIHAVMTHAPAAAMLEGKDLGAGQISLKASTSNRPRSLSFKRGITSTAMKGSVMKGAER